MSNNASKDGFGSRIGYIVSTLGAAVGVGAMWRFPMKTALNGGISCMVCGSKKDQRRMV